MPFQKTIKSEISVSGVGIHTGKKINIRLIPAKRDTGIVFYRTDRGLPIKAKLPFVIDTSLATTIGIDGVKIRTVEHLLATLYVFGITNLIIEIDGSEIPVMDGSAIDFAKTILKTGIAKQGKTIPSLKITKPIFYEETRSKIIAKPYKGFKITYKIFYEHPLILEQSLSIEINEQNFLSDIAPARTFGFLKDIQYLLQNGFARGGSLENALVLDEKGVVGGKLRFRDEFVRHKILDAIGDLSLLGYPIKGHFIIEKGGHTAHINFLKHLIESGCYELEEEPYFNFQLSAQTV
ncbi:MAG: UDP-3-O-acyl-N-acetylglucosamine deacetylase [Thermodesulfovibrio sp.]|uniref:UDP-3-O-acyl-N-acetylglucosamine deacetylase n=1 Tax=unclassified Thermodesulfovibrio TaxID=2645936 RepID=UPI00083A845D|nr:MULTISPECIES: UDP-3-O-acyl-N-acetylglucosamine deacetylase [unclassified Thermodesulfovibrio]MDI1472336.1 UDP-3-O-acyl-N-acetylglucosamine deacetylase [Thermodesulfovibrio sp. 1176]MDI6714201.1 UDP-3-O-acyl-N-acetylglucosamine deacetylase [Thermodesulfovibrio sp.]ODA43752.1 UDP-3-O-[3-hydroxymyristoyl] N-acetylglucosamine deacetylase [Thermodesulfovibrio sp. N1]